MYRIQPPFPATAQSLSSWVAELGTNKLPAKTIKAYLSGVRSTQIDMGFQDLDVFHHPILERILAGIRRLRGEADAKERRPVTRDILLRVLAVFNTTTRYGATLHAAFCLAFAGFLRIGEFTWGQGEYAQPDFSAWFLTRHSVELHTDYLVLNLPASKTDPFRKGVSLSIAAAGDDACAIKSLSRLFNQYPAAPTAPLFHTASGTAFTRRLVTDVLRQSLTSLGYTGHHSGHSFRRGAVTSARNTGLSEEEIMIFGPWKSDSYRLYIDINPDHILNASLRHQSSRV